MVDNELSEHQAVLGAPGRGRMEGLSACAARRHIGVIAFADDIATVARSPDEAQSILNVMSTFAAEQKTTWAPEKFVFLATLQLSLQIDGQALPQECNFKHLGVMIGVEGIAPKKHLELMCTHAQAKFGYIHSVGITNLGGNLNWVIGMYKAFIWPTMEYALEICIPNASLIKALERCQGDMLRTILGVPKSTSYTAIHLLCKMETMEHHWRAKISSCISRRQLDTDNKHILNGLFDIERVAQMKSSHLIPQLCQEAYCAGPPHRITTTISEKKQACLQALRGANKSATRVAQITSLGFICSMFVQHRTPIIHWLLGAVTIQAPLCPKCGGTISRDHATDCISAAAKLGPIIANALRKLDGQQRQHLQQANAIYSVLMALNKSDMASMNKIAFVIDKIYTHCLC
ncbi:hypothetical protein GGH92_006828 [Coemansia sp. RSA 2673]|nr:hypothetical protein GGH92_006828 [Coemansia sp. RSA 2673]